MIRKEHLKKLFSYPFWVHLLLALCMFAAIWLTYKDCLSARFQLDDGLRIANNTHVHMKEFSFKRWVTEPFRDQAKRRWFAMMTISLNYYFAWLKPFYYRLVNVFIHMGSALFFYLLLVQTFRIARGGFKREDETFIRIAAFFGTMIWALHPLQTSAVTYIIQRMTSLSGMLYLAALLLYVHGRKRKGLKRWLCYGGCFVVAVLAVGSKEPAIMIVATIPLYEFYFFRDLQFSKNPEKNRKAVYIFLGGGLVVFALVLWQGNYLVKLIGLSYERYDFDMYQRLLSQPRILVYYLSLIFWPRPHRICTDPSFMAHSSSLFHPWTTLPAFLFLGLYLYIAFFLRKKQKLLSFGMFWLLINLLVEQSFIPLQLLFHHRLYLPVTFFIAGLVFSFSEWARSLRLTSPALVAGSAVIALLGFSSYLRNDVWNSPHKIWEAELKLDPDSYRIMINLSKEYLDSGQYHKALPILYRAIEINPQGMGAYINIASVYSNLGQHEKAIFYLKQAVRTIKSWPQREAETVTLSFATNSERLKKYDEAEKYYMKALSYSTDRKYLIYYKLAQLYYWRDEVDEAISWAKKSVAGQDKFYQGQFFLGSLYAEKKDYANSEKCFLRALGGEPAITADAYKHLASLAEREGNQDKAIE